MEELEAVVPEVTVPMSLPELPTVDPPYDPDAGMELVEPTAEAVAPSPSPEQVVLSDDDTVMDVYDPMAVDASSESSESGEEMLEDIVEDETEEKEVALPLSVTMPTSSEQTLPQPLPSFGSGEPSKFSAEPPASPATTGAYDDLISYPNSSAASSTGPAPRSLSRTSSLISYLEPSSSEPSSSAGSTSLPAQRTSPIVPPVPALIRSVSEPAMQLPGSRFEPRLGLSLPPSPQIPIALPARAASPWRPNASPSTPQVPSPVIIGVRRPFQGSPSPILVTYENPAFQEPDRLHLRRKRPHEIPRPVLTHRTQRRRSDPYSAFGITLVPQSSSPGVNVAGPRGGSSAPPLSPGVIAPSPRAQGLQGPPGMAGNLPLPPNRFRSSSGIVNARTWRREWPRKGL
ncbi:hypothetical protein H4S08_004088 [Coemansia sp. RSA 1365]|nr:hypothetical protein H4S08_004088 [Coemansia sp. RSA 1365]